MARIEAEINTPDGTSIKISSSDESQVKKIVELFSAPKNYSTPKMHDIARPTRGYASLVGVAEVDEDGILRIICSDLKAVNARDAAKRLVFVTLFAREIELKEKKTPREEIAKILKSFGLYDGNSRVMVAREKGLIKEGLKFIWLSQPAKALAAQWVADIQNPELTGRWNYQGARKTIKSKSAKKFKRSGE